MSRLNLLTAPPDATGALYFLPGQYLFKRIENGREIAKVLSSEQIARAFRDFQTDTGWLTRRVLRYREEPDSNSFLSYEPARIRRIFVETDAGEIREIKLPLPSLVLLGKGREFYLWAARGNKVTAKTRLALAPLPNVGGDNYNGKICFGKNEVPEARADSVEFVWNLVWGAPFNSHHANGKCRTAPDDVRKLLFDLAKRRAKTFPSLELFESNTTVEQVWARIVENKSSYRF